MAAARGLPTASKHDSMDLCFLADDDYRRFLRDWAAEAMRPGPIIDRAGRVWGEHAGLPGYTVGQRKGLGISGAGEALFVLELDHARNALVVGTAAELGRDRLVATGVNWTMSAPVPPGTRAACKIRYKARAVPCTLHPLPGGDVEVRLDEALRDVSPGQGAVFYGGDSGGSGDSGDSGEVVLGGGVIAP
jgi:tRNA-specific 2-thiouridylase